MNIQRGQTIPIAMAMTATLLAAGAGSTAFAGGECAPELREVEAKLVAMSDTAAKEAARKLFESAKKAANNYDDEGCLERAKAALAKIAAAR